jgi:4-hydroxy-tetrahydrodipicolinate reductase
MGRALVAGIAGGESGLELSGALGAPADPLLGRDAGELADAGSVGVAVTGDRAVALSAAEVAIDFTLPEAFDENVAACAERGVAMVIGTTGLDETRMRALGEAAGRIPIVYGRNMSVGVNLFLALVERTAAALGEDYDVEIVEAHHRRKVDAPSGTALALGEAVARARGAELAGIADHARHGRTGAREPGRIGFAVIRAGGIVGEHTVLFASEDERLELTHRAGDRRVFAAGALRAAAWVAGRPPGLYGMRDVLGLE